MKVFTALSFFALVALASAAKESKEATCEECVLIVAELTVQLSTHDKEFTKHLHDNFCQENDLDNIECRAVAGHYPTMLVRCNTNYFESIRF